MKSKMFISALFLTICFCSFSVSQKNDKKDKPVTKTKKVYAMPKDTIRYDPAELEAKRSLLLRDSTQSK